MSVLVRPVLRTVSAEWLVMAEYVRTRLGQIEWELGNPERFRSKGEVIDTSLRRLHIWRRLLQTFREMVSEVLEQSIPIASVILKVDGNSSDLGHGQKEASRAEKSLKDIKVDFKAIETSIIDLQSRLDRLTNVVTAAISIEDSHRGLEENRNLARLTWLATTFIPMSFVTGFFSMQSDISTMKTTYGWYFLTAIPLTLIILALATLTRYIPLLRKTKE